MDRPEPSQPFWSGHKQNPTITAKIIAALAKAAAAHPTERVGQVIDNAVAVSPNATSLFTVWDEMLLEALEYYATIS